MFLYNYHLNFCSSYDSHGNGSQIISIIHLGMYHQLLSCNTRLSEIPSGQKYTSFKNPKENPKKKKFQRSKEKKKKSKAHHHH